MPKKNSPPSYRLHKARGCAVVTIDGKNHYLGRYGSLESEQKYARLIAERVKAGRVFTSAPTLDGEDLTLKDLVLRYWSAHVEVCYRKDGKPTDRHYHVRVALRPLRKLFGDTPIRDFGPKALQLVREEIINDGQTRRGGLNRNYVNDHIGIIRRMFRWAVSQELVPVSVYHALQTLDSVPKGRDPRLKESKKILPAPEDDVQAVLKVVSPQIRSMIELQLVTGMRPDEVTIMRLCDIDRSGDVWIYVPEGHKMDFRDIEKVVPLGPRAQKFLGPWLGRGPSDYFFSPKEAAEAARDRRRKTSRPAQRRDRKVQRQPRDHYDDESYCQAVERACEKAGVAKWTPGQLRHNAGTEIRREYGREAARLILGHRSASTTEIYAEKDKAKAIEIMKEMG